MKLKKNLFSFILTICLILPVMFALTACGENNPPAPAPEATVISEQGRTYTVANAETDIVFNWANDEKNDFEMVVASESSFRTDNAKTKVAFSHNGKATLKAFKNGEGMPENTVFYGVGQNNKLALYQEQAHTTQLTADQYAYDYQFNNTKEKLTITFTLPTCEHSTIAITLTAGPELLDNVSEYLTNGDEITINWNQAEMNALGEEYNLSTREDIEGEYINEEFDAVSYNVITVGENGKLLIGLGYYEILENGTIKLYKNQEDFNSKTVRTDITCSINADRTQITVTRFLRDGFQSTITAVYILQPAV